jgi:hypothetical protein
MCQITEGKCNDKFKVETAPLLKLFVTSTGIVNGFHNVPIDWIAVRSSDDLSPDLPWAAIFENYDRNEAAWACAKARVAEFFTEAEAKTLVEYLQRTDPEGAPSMEPVELPVPRWLAPTEEWIAGTDIGFTFPLSDRADYGLPFRVKGYCRFNGRLLIREEKSGFVVYMDEVPVSTPFANRGAGETWMSHLLANSTKTKKDACQGVPNS